MDKSMLIINTPKCCYDCDLCEWNYYGSICLKTRKNVQENNFDITKSRHETCPLKPLPEKNTWDVTKNGHVTEFAEGWNSCLEEITGE